MKTGVEIITEERERQINEKKWIAEHDAQYINGELANAASCYAMTPEARMDIGDNELDYLWPFSSRVWKPTPDDRIRELANAGALIAAEIDRLNNVKQGQV